MDKNLLSIELDKVLKLLADQAACEETKDRINHLKPISDLAVVNSLLKETQDAYTLLSKFGGPSFRGIYDVSGFIARAQAGGSLNMSELLKIANMLRGVRVLVEWRSHCEGIRTSLDKYFNELTPNKFLEEKIFSIIISEDEIADNASPALSDIRRKIRSISSSIRNQLDSMVRSSATKKYLQEAVVTFRNGRFVVPVKSEYRTSVPGMVHDTSASGATVFIEPVSVVNANNDIKVLEGKEREEIERILDELSAQVALFAENMGMSYTNIVSLDMIFAKAQLAYKMKASFPVMNDKGIIELKKARHPLIDAKKVVPTDIKLGQDFDTLIITGPNTGGKTVSIKTIGLLSAMAMCGMMIPAADESKLSVFNDILVDIGDEQSIEQSLSTFSGHMVNIIKIMSQAQEGSLVLIDELGAGTDPVEGAALAMAILENIHIKGAKIAATTHYAELKVYALQTARVENACCEFDVTSLKPTYRLLLGVPGRSNAFAISEKLGMDKSVIERAGELVSSDNRNFEKVVESLEETRQSLEKERLLAQTLSQRAREDTEKAKKIKDNIEKLKNEELSKARTQAIRITDKAKRESAALIDELNKLRADEKSAAEKSALAKRIVKRGLDKLEDISSDELSIVNDEYKDYKLPRRLYRGDVVFCKNLGVKGTVSSDRDKKGMYEIVSGLIKTKVSEDDIILSENSSASKRTGAKRTAPSGRYNSFDERVSSPVNTSCDLRGMTVEEAIENVDKFIDTCAMNSLGEVTVIHGKGTGALRKAVREFLRKCPAVDSYRPGVYGEGENGVTIVKLK